MWMDIEGMTRETHAAESVVLVVVLWVLDHVPPSDELVAVVAVLLVCEEVGLAQELLLVMLEFSHHFVGGPRWQVVAAAVIFFLLFVSVLFWIN